MEANPQFTKELKALEENFPGQVPQFISSMEWRHGSEVHSFAEHAAFSCEGTTSFFIEPRRL